MNKNMKEEITQEDRMRYIDDNLNDMMGILIPCNSGRTYVVHSDEWIRNLKAEEELTRKNTNSTPVVKKENFYIDDEIDKAKHFGYRHKVYNITSFNDIMNILASYNDGSLLRFLKDYKEKSKNIIVGRSYFIENHTYYNDIVYLNINSISLDISELAYNGKVYPLSSFRYGSTDVPALLNDLGAKDLAELYKPNYNFGEKIVEDSDVVTNLSENHKADFYISSHMESVINYDIGESEMIEVLDKFAYKGMFYNIKCLDDIINILNNIGGNELVKEFLHDYKYRSNNITQDYYEYIDSYSKKRFTLLKKYYGKARSLLSY